MMLSSHSVSFGRLYGQFALDDAVGTILAADAENVVRLEMSCEGAVKVKMTVNAPEG